MVQRAIDPQLGKLDFPGGYMDMADDSIEECAYRELFEEVGLEKAHVSKLSYLGSGVSPYMWQDSEIITAPFYFACELLTSKSALKVDPTENSQVRWIEKKDLLTIDFAWDIDRQMVTKFMEDHT